MNVVELYTDYSGAPPSLTERLAGSGSSRRYYRLTADDGTSVIGCESDDIAENEAFLYLTSHFAAKGLPVATVMTVAPDRSCYLLEDLGDLSLFDAIVTGRSCGIFPPEEVELLKRSIRGLADFQFSGAGGLDFSHCYPEEAMDRRMVMWDLNYFKYCFLKLCGLEFNEARLQDDFELLADELLAVEADTFMYRDFQSRNVMIVNGSTPFYIDFQGGRRGPVHYDIASFLWQAKAKLTPELREMLIDEYLDAASRYREMDPVEFRKKLTLFVLFRTLQVLGAYGYRGLIQKRTHFIESIPYAIRNLKTLVDGNVPARYPYLSMLMKKIIGIERFAPREAVQSLHVKVYSFSYRKGIPDDYSGNGGGFVFDCRAIHNPGRYEPYKQLTGRDPEVIKFLEDDGEVFTFLDHVYALVDASVETYLRRGFTSLMVCFGCTGGRHRSVYCAEHTARHINEKYGVHVDLIHRERDIYETLKPVRKAPRKIQP